MTKLFVQSALSLILAAGLWTAALAQSIEGGYGLQGIGADKSTHAGRVEVTKNGAGGGGAYLRAVAIDSIAPRPVPHRASDPPSRAMHRAF